MSIKRFAPIVFLTLLLLSTTVLLLPPFLYNELEYHFGREYNTVFDHLDKAEDGIQQRIALGSANTPDSQENLDVFVRYGDAIESSIYQASVGIQKAEKHARWQSRLLPLLNVQYKQYHQEKLKALVDHEQIVEDFYALKRNEHAATDTANLVFLTQNKALNFDNQDEWWEVMAQMPETTQTITENAEQLLGSGYINEELYAFYLRQVELFSFLHSQSVKVAQAEDWDEFNTQGWRELTAGSSQIAYNPEMFERMQQTMVDKSDDYLHRKDENLLAIHNNVEYYNNNQLAYDRLSLLLSMVSDKFPRLVDKTQ